MTKITRVDVAWALERLENRQTAPDIKELARDLLLRWLVIEMLTKEAQ